MPDSKLTAFIIDDEKMGRDALKVLMRNYLPQIELVGMADGIGTASPLLRELRPQLVFLDIEMPGENGFALWNHFPQPPFAVIFVTAFDQYAIQALRHSAIDYLMKPIDLEELEAAVARIQNRSPQPQIAPELLNLFTPPPSPPERLAIPHQDGFDFVDLSDIIHLEADHNYTRIHLGNGQTHLVSRNLGHYETLLSGTGFYRIHSSHIINLSCLQRYKNGRGGQVELTNGQTLPVASRRRQEFLEALTKWDV